MLTKFSEFFMCWVFQEEISRKDRLATTIAISVDPPYGQESKCSVSAR